MKKRLIMSTLSRHIRTGVSISEAGKQIIVDLLDYIVTK